MDEFWKVYSVAEGEQDQLLLFMYLHTGARRDELFRLRWKDIDFQGKRILLSSRKNKAGEWEQKWIPAGEDLLSMLRTHQKVTGLLGFVFLNQCDHDPQKWIPYQYRNKWMPQLCKRARVTPFGIHGIRHLTASLLAGANLPLIAIKEMLRHKSINTTQRYIHSLSEGNREVLEALPGIGEIAKNALRTPCKVDGFLKQSASS
jgi:integrase